MVVHSLSYIFGINLHQGKTNSRMYSSCFPRFQLHWVSSLLHWERWVKDVSVCEVVKRHTSITVSLHCLNVLLMREGEGDRGDGWGEGQNERKGQKDRKAWIQESWLLSRFHSIPSSGFWWWKREREKEREREHLCVSGNMCTCVSSTACACWK